MSAPPFKPPMMTYPPITSGPGVKQWQQQMKTRGWNISPDGKYGPISQRTCKNFQSENALKPDGIVGPVTWKAAWEAATTTPPPAPEEILEYGSQGDHVLEWQRQADSRGWRIKNIDGYFDDEDASACILMQRALGLADTGKVDHETWDATWLERVPTAAS
ncbi:peptidoglycan-binding protein [Actinomadura soli]|uniref:Peptidoglycan-binding protein n=1 Tax=Actinomadura soli TaxID=2508997 RepID=A0A5C4JKX7_9ACTN|nr:peptidoglycan-binding protein [Actinomadura soli]TMR07365.1 peptidoglycan-binding protein [Actinomadura soli]